MFLILIPQKTMAEALWVRPLEGPAPSRRRFQIENAAFPFLNKTQEIVRWFLCFVFYSLLNSLLGFFQHITPPLSGIHPHWAQSQKTYTKVQFLYTYFFKRQFNSTGSKFATVQNAVLEIRLHGKFELFHKDFLECRDIILLIENQHGFLVIDGFYSTERKWAVAVRY